MYVFLEPERRKSAFINIADIIYFKYMGVWSVCTKSSREQTTLQRVISETVSHPRKSITELSAI